MIFFVVWGDIKRAFLHVYIYNSVYLRHNIDNIKNEMQLMLAFLAFLVIL